MAKKSANAPVNIRDLAKYLMNSYRNEVKATIPLALDYQNAEIDSMATRSGGRKPERKLERLSKIARTFAELFGNIRWNDQDKFRQVIAVVLPPNVAADGVYQNAMKNSTKRNAGIERPGGGAGDDGVKRRPHGAAQTLRRQLQRQKKAL